MLTTRLFTWDRRNLSTGTCQLEVKIENSTDRTSLAANKTIPYKTIPYHPRSTYRLKPICQDLFLQVADSEAAGGSLRGCHLHKPPSVVIARAALRRTKCRSRSVQGLGIWH